MREGPIEKFKQTLSRAESTGMELFNAAALATADKHGQPSVRVVLLKDVDENGFVFYTNLESRKGVDIEENPLASLCFWWPELQEQIRIEGPIERVSDEEADAYFATRDRESQIGAWASSQSRELGSREVLLERFQEAQGRFEGRSVPRPAYWSGYRVVPEQIEFWYGRPHRLHERILYRRRGVEWEVVLLYP